MSWHVHDVLHPRRIEALRAELDTLKSQVAQQTPTVFLFVANVHVSYGSCVTWKETGGEHRVYITNNSLKDLRGYSLVDSWEDKASPFIRLLMS